MTDTTERLPGAALVEPTGARAIAIQLLETASDQLREGLRSAADRVPSAGGQAPAKWSKLRSHLRNYPLLIVVLSIVWYVAAAVGWVLLTQAWDYWPFTLTASAPIVVWFVVLAVRIPIDRDKRRDLLSKRFDWEREAFRVGAATKGGYPGSDELALRRAENLLAHADIERRIDTQANARNLLNVVLLAAPLMGGVVVFYAVDANSTRYVVAIASFFAVLEILALSGYQLVRTRLRSLEAERGQLLYERNLLIAPDDGVARAEKFFLKQEYEAQRYYDEQLRQSAMLSYFGVFCITIGVLVVGVVLYLVTTDDARDTTTVIVLGALGGVSGILTNFVAYSFVRMHAVTAKALRGFHARMAEIQAAHLAALERVREAERIVGGAHAGFPPGTSGPPALPPSDGAAGASHAVSNPI